MGSGSLRRKGCYLIINLKHGFFDTCPVCTAEASLVLLIEQNISCTSNV
ncbi:unnamed protein product [Musa acuminata subsp. burmannicoides]